MHENLKTNSLDCFRAENVSEKHTDMFSSLLEKFRWNDPTYRPRTPSWKTIRGGTAKCRLRPPVFFPIPDGATVQKKQKTGHLGFTVLQCGSKFLLASHFCYKKNKPFLGQANWNYNEITYPPPPVKIRCKENGKECHFSMCNKSKNDKCPAPAMTKVTEKLPLYPDGLIKLE